MEVNRCEAWRPGIGQAGQVFPHPEAGSSRNRECQLTGNETELANRFRYRQIRAGPLHDNPNQKVHGYNRCRNYGRTLSLILVTIGNHRARQLFDTAKS